MKDVDVIVLNSHGVGQVCHVKRLPRKGETLAATGWIVEEDGGKGVTVSVALGRLGVKTAYIGKVGYDPWGEMGEKWLMESGVDARYMYKDHSVATGTGLIMIDEEGYNTIVDGDSACRALTEEEIKNALEDLKDAKYFITGFGMPYEKALMGAKMAKKNYKMTTLCNISPLPDGEMGKLDYLDFMILNDVEAKALMGFDEDENVSMEKLAKALKEKYSCGGLVITCGENGSYILDANNKIIKIEATKVDAKYTIGAGDGYLAAMVAGLVWGKDIEKACDFASKYAAFKVTRPGTMTKKKGMGYPYLNEVEKFISIQNKLNS